MTELQHQLDPDQFATVRDSNAEPMREKTVLELARDLVYHIERDPVRTTHGAVALAAAIEMRDRLNGD